MASSDASRRYRASYARLLRFYPQQFRERFAEPMSQNFSDLCRESTAAGRGLFGLALWIFGETLKGIVKEHTNHMPQLIRTMLAVAPRVAVGALALWMVPVVAAQFVEDWHWGVAGFARFYALFFVVGMAMALIARRMDVWSYKAGVVIALAAGFGLAWSTMVQTADSDRPERLWYLSVLAVGLVGAALSRLRAPGLSATLFAMAAVLAVISLILPSGAPPDQALRMAIGHAVYVVLFTAAGLLFRRASQDRLHHIAHGAAV